MTDEVGKLGALAPAQAPWPTRELSSPGEQTSPPDTPRPTRSGLASSYVVTLAGSAGIVAINLFTGVVTARLLSPDGRGAVGAIAGWVMVASVLSGFGFREGMSWIESREPQRASAVLTTSMIAIFVTSGAGIAAALLLVPVGFSAQSDEVIRYAQIFMIWILPYSACYAFTNLLGARQRFGSVTAMRVGQPVIFAMLLGALWFAGEATVFSVLLTQMISFVIPAAYAAIDLTRDSGLARPDLATAKEGARYGIKAFGSTFGFLANSRLDLMVLPAIVVTSEIGLYVVAVSAGSMLVGLFGSLRVVVFPAAARVGGAEAVRLTQQALRVVLVATAASALILAVFAEVLVRVLYGGEFAGAVAPLRLLLPGVACWAAAQITTSGLKGLGRPFVASIAQFSGVFVTIVGLYLLLERYGINGAAFTSSVSYFVVLIISLVGFAAASGTRIRDTLSPRAMISDVRWAARRLRTALLRRRVDRSRGVDLPQ